MICVAKNDVWSNSIDADPLNLRGDDFVGVAFLALQRSRKLFEISSHMAGRTGNLFLNMLGMRKIQWLTNRGRPAKVEKG